MVQLALSVAGVFGGLWTVTYAQLRHAMLAAVALLPFIAVPVLTLLLKQDSSPAMGLPACLFGMAWALALVDRSVRVVAVGAQPPAALAGASRAMIPGAGAMLAVYVLSLGADAAGRGTWLVGAREAALFAAALAAAFAGAWLSAFLPYTEEFVARSNSTRERRERAFDRLAFVVEKRWALSIGGIAVVLATIAAFAIRDADMAWSMGAALRLACPVGLLWLGFALISRDWRTGLGAALCCAFAGAILMWAEARLPPVPLLDGPGRTPIQIDILGVTAFVTLAATPLAMMVVRMRECLRDGDALPAALLRGICDEGATTLAVSVVVAALGLWATASSGNLSPALAFAAAMVFAVLVLFPALVVAIHALVPRYRSVDEVFGRK